MPSFDGQAIVEGDWVEVSGKATRVADGWITFRLDGFAFPVTIAPDRIERVERGGKTVPADRVRPDDRLVFRALVTRALPDEERLSIKLAGIQGPYTLRQDFVLAHWT